MLRVILTLDQKHTRSYEVCVQEAFIIVVNVKRRESVYLLRSKYGEWLEKPFSCPGAERGIDFEEGCRGVYTGIFSEAAMKRFGNTRFRVP